MIRRELRIAFVFVALLYALPATAAGNPCADGGSLTPVADPDDEGGIGGTGILGQPEGGVGGTGRLPASEGGLGGTGVRAASGAEEGGVGGTGIETAEGDRRDQGGIGGTGILATGEKTAIAGTVTGFASLCVGGTEIHLDAATPVTLDGRPATMRDLAIGEFVEVVARGVGDEVTAVEVRGHALVIGPVTSVESSESSDGMLRVAGQRVAVSSSTWGADGPLDGATVAADMTVRVVGLRRPDGVIDASRIEPVADADVSLSGTLRSGPDGAWTIDGTEVRFAERQNPVAGQVRATGQWRDGALRVVDLRPVNPEALVAPVERVQVEGYLTRTAADEAAVAGLRLVGGDSLVASYAGKRVRVVGSVEAGGRIRVDSVAVGRPRVAVPRVAIGGGGAGPVRGDGLAPQRKGAPPGHPRSVGHAGSRPPKPPAPQAARPPRPSRPPQVHHAPPMGRRPPPPPPPPPPRP